MSKVACIKVGIFGAGHVGTALASGLKRAGHETRAVGRDAAAIRETVAWAGLLVLAVPYAAVDDVVALVARDIEGKTLVDATNPLDARMELSIGFSLSAAEVLQEKLPGARVVKAFNTIFARHMDTGCLGDQRLTTFVAGDDLGPKGTVLGLARQLGFDAVDAGPLKNARLLEPLGALNTQLGLAQGLGTQIGFRLVQLRPSMPSPA